MLKEVSDLWDLMSLGSSTGKIGIALDVGEMVSLFLF